MDEFRLSVPWPSPEDDLFGSDGAQWRALASLHGRAGAVPMSIYATGYREAAEVLVKEVLRSGHHQDFLVYPIMFLYRQYVELRLKEIAVLGARLADEGPPPPAIMNQHVLLPLWQFCRDVIRKADDGPTDDLDNAERTLQKITWADHGSYAFRYSTDKQGHRSLPHDLDAVDLARVFDVMSGVGNLLDAIIDWLQAEQDLKDEWQQEMRSLYG